MKRTTIMADEETLVKIDRIAREKGATKSDVIREALVAYIADFEREIPAVNPLMALIGLAGDDAVPMDLANGGDEEAIRETMDPLYGWTATQ